MSLKKEIIGHLEEIADLMEFLGENKFKISAFRNGSNIIRNLNEDIEELILEDKLKNINGVGKSLRTVIKEFFDNGYSAEHKYLSEKVPAGILELFLIRGLGAKKIRQLNTELSITTINELELACVEGRIARIKGFGAKTEEKILTEIIRLKSSKGYIHLNKAEKLADSVLEKIERLNSVIKCQISGELRRSLEIISEISIVVLSTKQDEFEAELAKIFNYNRIEDNQKLQFGLKTDSAISVLVTVCKDICDFYEFLFLDTGSDDFVERFDLDSIEQISSEDDIFRGNGISFIIPEMREKEYFYAPEELRVNSTLKLTDFKGLLHFHTNWSDGMNTLREMISSAKEIGFEYAAVCDHSKTAFYANGLSEDRISLQKKEIDKINEMGIIPVLHGIESDILNNGYLDYGEDILMKFDFVVASVHTGFNLSEDEMTKRIVKAVENPYTDVLGHPTGRLLLSRDPYKLNIHKVIDACFANSVAVEINTSPYRLDLDWRNIYYAREKGCKLSINADAHSTEGLDDHRYGISIAKKAGTQISDVINCLDFDDFKKFLNRKVARKL